MSKTQVGIVVVVIARAGVPDSYGRILTIDALHEIAKKSGGALWVIGEDLLTHVPLEGTNKLRLDD